MAVKPQAAAHKQKSPSMIPAVEATSSSVTPALQRSSEEGAAPMTPKNFRNHPDMENFFRFIYENDLRLEALEIVDGIIAERKAKRKKNA